MLITRDTVAQQLAAYLFLVTPLLLLVIQRSLYTSPSETVLGPAFHKYPHESARPEEARRAVSKPVLSVSKGLR
jgi:hypothetical protein